MAKLGERVIDIFSSFKPRAISLVYIGQNRSCEVTGPTGILRFSGYILY